MSELQHVISSRIPDGWTSKPLWALFRRRKITGYADEELLSVYRDYGVIPKSSRDDNHNKESEDLSGYQLVTEGALVTNKMKAWQGSIAISRYRGIVSPAYYVYEPLSDEDDQFLHYLLRSKPYIELYGRISKGVRVNQWDLEHEALRTVPVMLPDRETQKAIAGFLDRETARIDQLIEKKQRFVELLAERFEATVSNLTSPPSDQSHDWIERPIKTLATVFGRIGFRGYTTEDIVEEGEGAITLSPSNIRDGQMVLGERTYISWQKYNESPEIQISQGDIVFVKTGSTIGKVAKVDDLPEPMTLNPQLVVLKNIIPDRDFLLFSMQSKPFQYQVSFNRFGGSTPAMSQGNLGRLRVCLPQSKDEQRRRAGEIIEERQQIDKMKGLLSSTISRLHEFRSSMITAAVTGQINVASWGEQGQTDRGLDQIEEDMAPREARA
ncbi:MAG: restriction endonuclease subunit S [Rhizobiaceae bacterium]|nr:restriction endonuclease subunit S [Rhizobiaceae bacterium]